MAGNDRSLRRCLEAQTSAGARAEPRQGGEALVVVGGPEPGGGRAVIGAIVSAKFGARQ